MEVKYELQYLKKVISEDIPKIPNNIKGTIKKAIEERLGSDPISFGRPLKYSWKGHRRLRVGDYRIVYKIDQPRKIVVIIAIKHRREVYQN